MNARASAEEPERQIGELLKLGRVVSVDLIAGRCVVELGDEDEGMQTASIPIATGRAGETRVFCPPSVGEQVLVALPEADIERAILIGSLFSDDCPPPAADGSTIIHWADGARISYDPAGHSLGVQLPAGGTINITADAGVSIVGPVSIQGAVTIEGDVGVTGKVEASDDVVGGGKSLRGHKHTGVQGGGSQSGPPA